MLQLEGEGRIGVLYDAPPAVGPDHPVTGPGDAPHLLDVELLEAPAVVGHDPHPLVRHLAAPLHRQLLQVGAVLGQQLQPSVSHLTLPCSSKFIKLKGSGLEICQHFSLPRVVPDVWNKRFKSITFSVLKYNSPM